MTLMNGSSLIRIKNSSGLKFEGHPLFDHEIKIDSGSGVRLKPLGILSVVAIKV